MHEKVDRLFVGPELFEKRPVVRRGVGDGNQFGPHLADMSDLFGELRRRLADFRPKTKRFLPSASWKLTVPQDAQHASSSPSGRSGTPSSETAHGFAGFRFADAVHGLLLPFLPEIARRTSAWLDDGFMPPNSPKSLAASRGVQWSRRAAAGFIRQSGPLSTGENDSFSERVRKTGPNSVGLLRPRSPNLAVLPGRPSRPGVLAPPGTAQRPAYPTSKSANAPLPFDPFLDEGCERPERLGGRGPLLDDGRKSPHRLGGCRGELRERQTVTATLAWE